MDEGGKKLLNLMFRAEEEVGVSCNKYSYHSIPLKNALNGPVVLIPPGSNQDILKPSTDELILVALNPIKGFGSDANCYNYRNFLVELDCASVPKQLAYIKRLRLPYSAAVFSVNKSVHFLISLSKDLPSEKIYRFFSTWLIPSVPLADQNTINPSRKIRIPGGINPKSGGRQELLELKQPIEITELLEWLKQYPETMPVEKPKVERSDKPDFSLVKPWACKALLDASKHQISNRNKTWYALSVELSIAGYSEEQVLSILEHYFVPEHDFTRREWLTAVKSGIKTASQR